jgi:thioredoxin-related protein
MKRFNRILIFFLLIACNNNANFKRLNGNPVNIDTKTLVFIFLNTECPICQKYQGSFSQYKNDSVFYVFPGSVSKEDVLKYAAYDSIDINQIVIDNEFKLTRHLNATTTPQAVVTNNGKIIYSGLIDDRFVSLGSTRSIAHINYIRNALNSLLQNDKVAVSKTEPVGCFIEPH